MSAQRQHTEWDQVTDRAPILARLHAAEPECDHHGCVQPGELPVEGCPSIRLCLVHWLRDRVRLALADCA